MDITGSNLDFGNKKAEANVCNMSGYFKHKAAKEEADKKMARDETTVSSGTFGTD